MGRRLIKEILDIDPRNEKAWLWLTEVVDTQAERIECLQTVLKINPADEAARRGLTALQSAQPNGSAPVSASATKTTTRFVPIGDGGHATIRVLLIEDDAALCEILEFMLSRKGFEVKSAHDGETGLNMALELEPDILVLDLKLPDMDGSQIALRLKAVSEVPIIMLTAMGSWRGLVKDALKQGVDDYMVKPVGVEELAARIRDVLQRSAPAPTDQAHQPSLAAQPMP